MIFWNSWIDVCKRQLWSVCSAPIQYKNPAGTWRQNDVILTSIRRHCVTSTSVWRRYDIMCLLGRFNAHFAEIYNQAILITQASDLNLENNIQWEKKTQWMSQNIQWFEIDSEPMKNGLFLDYNIDYHPVSDVTYINVTLKYWAIVLSIAHSRLRWHQTEMESFLA